MLRKHRGETKVLFHQKDGKAPLLEGADRLADLLNNDRSETFCRLVQQQEAGVAKINTLPDSLRLSLTWDQGPQMRECRHVCIDAGIDIYFCDPHSPWQRGTNENTRADGHPALEARPGCRVGETALRAARRQA